MVAVLVAPTGFSMPSRHAMTATLGLGLAADRFAACSAGPWRSGARLGGSLVAVSRVVLAVHWPSDTVAGFLVGVGVHSCQPVRTVGREQRS
jgi:membrane-associated phospholipid phosphatase